MNESNTYSANDIERYHRGEMTPAEMHLLEEASLDDPFLADALEGYQNTATPSADLGALQKRLQERMTGKQKSGVLLSIYPWMKIAAVLVVLIGGVWLVLQTVSERSSKLANTMKRTNAEKNAAELLDSSSPVPTQLPSLSDSKREKENNNVASVEVKKSAGNTHQKPLTFSAPSLTKKDTFADDKSGYVANTIAKTEARAASEDNISSPPPEQPTAAASAPELDTVRHIDVVMKPIDGSLQEVVVAKSKARKLGGRTSGVTIDTLEPAQGWSSFDNYVADNLKVPKELKEKKPLVNEVELRFDVDKEGNPVNIAVTQPLCDKCDQEAVRLLKEGPKWKGKKKNGKVKIRFPLSP